MIFMNKKINKMPKILKLSLFLLTLGILSGGLLAIVNEFTKDIILKNELDKYYSELVSLGVKSESIKEMEVEKEEGIEHIYRANTNDNLPCYVFVIYDKNSYTTVKTIVLIEITTEKILNIKVSAGATTHNFDVKFINNDFGVVGSKVNEFATKFEIVTGATVSSNSVKKSIKLVEKQLLSFEGKMQFKTYVQCLPNYTHFEYTFNKNNEDIILLLKYNESTKTFKYVNTLLGEVLDEDISECVALANINLPTNCIKNVYNDANGSKLTIVTDKGFKGEIVAEVKIYNNQIISFEIKTSNENYQYNSEYIYEGKVEDYIFEQYDLGSKNTIVTGATVTSKAINYLLSIADNYINSLEVVK